MITSRKNQSIQLLRSLMRERSTRYEHNMFVLEGTKLLTEALSSGYKPINIYVTEKALIKYKELFKKTFDSYNYFVINEDLSQYIADTSSPQGIFFTLPLLDKILNLDTICNSSEISRFIMLDDLQDLGNVGTIIRTADAFGLDGIILSENTCDIHSPKLIRGAMGSVFRLPVYRANLIQKIKSFTLNDYSVYAAMLDETAISLDDMKWGKKSCVIIGNEGHGITKDIIGLCTDKIYIPIKNAQSLNAAVAASIIIYSMK